MSDQPFCPECGAAQIVPRTGRHADGGLDRRWRCTQCGARFNKPERRIPDQSKVRWPPANLSVDLEGVGDG